MQWMKCCLFTIISLFYSNCFAVNTNYVQNMGYSQANWLVGIGTGEQYSHFKKNVTLNNGSNLPAPYYRDIYSTRKINRPMLDITIGKRFVRDNPWLPIFSLGLFYQHRFATNIGNTITQYSLPEFNNYQYRWDVSSNLLLAFLKLNLFECGKFSPYIFGGAGTAFHHSHYRETALPGVTARLSPRFSTKTSTRAAYGLGGGLDFQFAKQAIFSVEYQYQDIGVVATGKGKSTWHGKSLHMGPSYANTLLFNLSYLLS